MFYGLFLCCQKVCVPVALEPKLWRGHSAYISHGDETLTNKTVALKFLNDASRCLPSVIPIRKGQSLKWNKDGETVERFSCVFCPEIRAFKNFILIQEKYSKDTGQVEAAEPGYLLSFFFSRTKNSTWFMVVVCDDLWPVISDVSFVTTDLGAWFINSRTVRQRACSGFDSCQ